MGVCCAAGADGTSVASKAGITGTVIIETSRSAMSCERLILIRLLYKALAIKTNVGLTIPILFSNSLAQEPNLKASIFIYIYISD